MDFLLNKNLKILIIFLLLIFSYYCSIIIGISWDELFEINRGQDRLKYLFSLGSYDIAPAQNDKYYPGLYSTISAFISNALPKKYIYESFHIINNTFSIITIFGLYKLVKILFNKYVALLAFIILFFNPTFFGHMSMNPKDTIIAFSFVWTTLTLLRYLSNQNNLLKRKKFIIYASLFIGLGLGTRIQFISLLIPLFLYVLIFSYSNKQFSLSKFFIDMIKIFIISYFIMIICWPQVHSNIFIEPFRIFFEQLKIHFGPDAILLNSKVLLTSKIPFYYIFLNLFFKSPEYIILTYLFFLPIIIYDKKFINDEFDNFYNKILLLIFIIISPTIFIIFSSYKVYDGLRLFLYIIPFYCIIPSITIYYLIKKNKIFLIKVISFIISLFFIFHIYNFIKITPYQYTYFNLFSGSKDNLVKKFEIDYWGISLNDLIREIVKKDYIKKNGFTNIAICGMNVEIAKIELKKYPKFKYKLKNYWNEDYDYIMMNNRPVFKDKKKIITCYEKFPTKSIVDIKRNNVILSSFKRAF